MATSPSLSTRQESVRAEVLALAEKKEDGVVSTAELKRKFGDGVDGVLAHLCEAKQLEATGDGFRLRAGRQSVLTQEQLLVLQVVERAGNTGVWLRDIKSATSLQQQILNKALRMLETQKMVKTVKSVQQKTRKLYMSYDLQPTREISGGPWYTAEQEFDHGYVDELKLVILRFIRQTEVADLAAVEESVKMMKISKVPLEPRDIRTLVDALVCDGKIEECTQRSTASSGGHVTKRRKHLCYKIAKDVPDADVLTAVPCGVCPNRRRCRPGGIVSPQNCLYLDKWLAMPGDDLPDLEDLSHLTGS